jgi:Zn-dependent protease with chaperone function
MQNVAGILFLLVYFPVALHKINWALEFDADKTAVKFVGQKPLEQALLLASEDKVNRATLTHPSPAERIRRSKSY